MSKRLLTASLIAIFTFSMLSAQAFAINGADSDVLGSGALPYYWATQQQCSGQPSSSTATSNASSSSPVVWPFATKDPTQYQRVDQGWDLQTTAGAAVYAIASGTIHQFNPNPGGFGNDYPTELLDNFDGAIQGDSNWVYYGHVHVLPSVLNQHVTAGQEIATTNTTNGLADGGASENGSAAPAGWLEIGFAQPNTDAPVASGYEGTPTQAGQDMKNLLIGANPDAQGGSYSSINCSCQSSFGGNLDQFMQAEALIESGDNITAGSPGAASGKYQFEPGTWNSPSNQALYGPAKQYAYASAAPEDVQDAFMYLVNAGPYQQFDGDLFALAVGHYGGSGDIPKAHANHNDPSLNVVPAPGNTLTLAQYGNLVVQAIQSGNYNGRALSSVTLSYTSAPDFQLWLAKQGLAATTQTSSSSASASTSSGCSNGIANGSFVFYSQYDPRWAAHAYGTSTIQAAGCGPTSVAEVVATLADNTITPIQTADYGTSIGAYIPDEGSDWTKMLIQTPEHYGLTVTSLGANLSQAVDILNNGGLVIIAGTGAAPFTPDGHILVLRGIDSNGNFLVGDPNSPVSNPGDPNLSFSAQQIIGAGLQAVFGVTKGATQ